MRKLFFLLLLSLTLSACSQDAGKQEVDKSSLIPSLDEYSQEEQEKIKQGQTLMTHTNTALPENVRNNLSCVSCHAGAGRGDALTLIGVDKKFPQHSKREGREISLSERVNGCFARSMNGEPIDPESEEMDAFLAYLKFLSDEVESGDQYDFMTEENKGENIPVPDVERGAELFERNNCISCHGKSGPEAAYSGPDLWGKNSFNDGAGMSRFSDMQDFIKKNMPLGEGGTLNDQEAADLAAYVLSHERPEFQGENRFPDGGKPDDYITEKEREAIKENIFEWEELERVENSE
ncbi:MAG TPA: c-type cytochrome [Candidatus Salinicoccus stercoripullorum]|uniref:C-type cytochrome n=1 Tax=Candidatus Salinicoccus stercoripullorum TaxID=2838756 RepID=A0A9D1QJ67_9STAP|nr:c-type cytochrome [Candidatus Salinicoccus stercoripullorum]